MSQWDFFNNSAELSGNTEENDLMGVNTTGCAIPQITNRTNASENKYEVSAYQTENN